MEKSYADILRNEIAIIRELTRFEDLELLERITKLEKSLDKYALAFATQYEPEREMAREKGRDWPNRYYDANLLEQAANLVLHEDLTNKLRNKSAAAEYPFLSEMQLARRQNGSHARKNTLNLGETNFVMAETVAQDGRNYKKPARRKRSAYESLLVDANAKIRNKERKSAYKEFTKDQPVVIYNVGEILR